MIEDDNDDYDVVVNILHLHRARLYEMTRSNMRAEIGMGIMDDIRLEQISEIDECLRVWKEYCDRRSTRTTKD